MNNLLSGLAEYVKEEKTAGLESKRTPLNFTKNFNKQDALRKAKFDAYEKMLKKNGPIVDPTPDLPKSNRNRNIGLGLTGGAAATGTGLYAYNRYKKKKRAEAEEEKTAAAPKREEVVQRRKLASNLKKKVKKKGVKKLKKGIHKPVRQKKTANFNDTELEKIASLMADQFIAATSLQNVDPDNMNFEQEVLAGYKSFIDEVNVDGVE